MKETIYSSTHFRSAKSPRVLPAICSTPGSTGPEATKTTGGYQKTKTKNIARQDHRPPPARLANEHDEGKNKNFN
jgi:hypothetical protein